VGIGCPPMPALKARPTEKALNCGRSREVAVQRLVRVCWRPDGWYSFGKNQRTGVGRSTSDKFRALADG
jgi:hypothetical protein